MRTLVSLLATLLIAAAAHATDPGEPMKDASTPRTLCLGRFLVDVPKDVVITGQSSDYRGDSIRVTRRVSQEAFLRFITDKEKMLKETAHKTEPSLLKHISKSGDGTSVTLVFWEAPTTRHVYETELYKWVKGYQFLIKGNASQDKVALAVNLANRTLSELQYRRDGEIPTVPGFCVDGGFFAGEPGFPHYESTFFNLHLKSHPDVRISIDTRTNGEKVGEGLLARVDGKPTPDIYKELDKKTKVLRRGKHPVGNIEAEELSEAIPAGETFLTHSLTWEARGKPRDIYAPTIVVDMNTGEGPSGGIVRPSVTDQQAMEIFDSIVNSIRLRPIGGAAIPEPPKPAPRPQAKAPLGTQLISGSRCPQSGTWVCEHHEALGGNRRFFAEGETLASVIVPVRRSVWQQVKGEAGRRQQETVWTLAEISSKDVS